MTLFCFEFNRGGVGETNGNSKDSGLQMVIDEKNRYYRGMLGVLMTRGKEYW